MPGTGSKKLVREILYNRILSKRDYAIRCKEPQERPSGLLIEQVTRLSNRKEERKASPGKEKGQINVLPQLLLAL